MSGTGPGAPRRRAVGGRVETRRTVDGRGRRTTRRSRRADPVLLVPLLVLGLVVAAALAPAGGEGEVAPRPVPVAQTSYACSGAPDVLTGQVEAGTAASATRMPGAAAVADAADPAAWVRSPGDDGGEPSSLLVTQDGVAAGAVGFVSGVLDDEGDGLVVGRCPGVVDDAWFAGLGSGEGHLGSLLLTNLADTPAVVDVSLWSADGPLEAVGGDGLVVDPGAVRVVQLADLAAGEPTLGVHLSRRRGAVSVAALDTLTGTPAGSELVAAAEAPARRQVLAGLPAGDRGRSLTVLNPGSEAARVRVEALGPDGPFVPEGLDEVRVGAGSVASMAVPRSAGSGAVALRLVSDVPVVASASAAPEEDDVAVVGAAPVWEGPAVAPLDGDVGTPDLVLTAPGGAARRVVVEAVDADRRVVGRAEVEVAAGTTVGLDPADELDLGGATVLVVRSTGGVVGSAQYRDGDRRAALVLTPAPTRVPAPQVRPAP